MSRLLLHPQAEAFLRTLAPEPKARIVKALKALPSGDIKELEGRLAGYARLRVGGYRVIFADRMESGIRTFHCVFAERRPVVYELFERILAEQALS